MRVPLCSLQLCGGLPTIMEHEHEQEHEHQHDERKDELMAPTPTYFIAPGAVQTPQQRHEACLDAEHARRMRLRARDIDDELWEKRLCKFTRKRARTCDNLMRNKRNCPVGY